jgi:hypothetical protein
MASIVTTEQLKETFRLSKSLFPAKIKELDLIVEYYEFLCNPINAQVIRSEVYENSMSITNVRSRIQTKKNLLVSFVSSDIAESIHSKYKAQITSKFLVPLGYDAIAFQRQSVNKGYTLKQGLATKSNMEMGKNLQFNPFEISITISGYKSPLLAILEQNKHVKAVFVESVDRLARNLGLTIDLLDYCALHKISIYVGSNLMNRGIGRATLLLLAVFAEFELTSKQTSYSSDLLNVIKFEKGLIEFDALNDGEIKLFNNLQFVEQSSVFEKSAELSYKYIQNYENKTLTKNGKRKANNPLLYANAKEIMKIVANEEEQE